MDNQVIKPSRNQVVAAVKGGDQVRFNITTHASYRTFKRIWNAVTGVALEKEVRLFLGSEKRAEYDVSRYRGTLVERGEIRRSFSIYRKTHNVDFAVDPTDNNTRLYPVDKTIDFIESFIYDLRNNPDAL